MRIPPGTRQFTLNFPKDLADQVDSFAESMDLATRTWVVALITAALDQGRAEALVSDAISRGRVPSHRALRSHSWKFDGKGQWHQGPFRLARVGRGGAHPQPGEGWWLSGPGIDPPVFVGLQAREARLLADRLIQGRDTRTHNTTSKETHHDRPCHEGLSPRIAR